jgi:hypothetical protein
VQQNANSKNKFFIRKFFGVKNAYSIIAFRQPRFFELKIIMAIKFFEKQILKNFIF